MMAKFFKKKKDDNSSEDQQVAASAGLDQDTPGADADSQSAAPPEAAATETDATAKKARKPLFGRGKKDKDGGQTVKGSAEKPKKARKARKEKQPKVKKVKEPKEKKARKPLFGKKGEKQAQPEPKKEKPKKKKSGRSGGIGGSKVSPVGLDIGRTSITATRLKHQTGGSILLQAALDTLPEGLISEGEVRDVEALGFALKDFWKNHKIKSRKVSIGLANQKVVVRALDFPILDEKELQSAIEFQAQDYIPIPAEGAVFAHHVMGKSVDDAGIEMQKVLVVAAQKDMVMDFINAMKKAKLTVDNIDLQAFAMMRSLRAGSFLDQETPREAVAIANIASDITNIVVDVGGDPQFTRIISFGGDDFTRAVAEHQGIRFDEAEIMKIKIGLPVPGAIEIAPESTGGEPADDSVPFLEETGPEDIPFRPESSPEEPQAGEVPPAPRQSGTAFGPDELRQNEGDEDAAPMSEAEQALQMQRVLEVTAETLADELRRSFDYYMSQESAVPISMLLLSGGGALMPNLHSHLSQMFPFEVRMGEPTARIVENKSDLTDDELKALAPRLAIAIGLSLEDEES